MLLAWTTSLEAPTGSPALTPPRRVLGPALDPAGPAQSVFPRHRTFALPPYSAAPLDVRPDPAPWIP